MYIYSKWKLGILKEEFSVMAPDVLCCGCCFYTSEAYSNEWSKGLSYITEQGNSV